MTNRPKARMIVGMLAATGASSPPAATTTPRVPRTVIDAATTSVTTPATTAPPEATPTTADPATNWETVEAPADCMCGDGSGFQYFVRKADPTKVLFFMEAAAPASAPRRVLPTARATRSNVGEGPLGGATGIFDFANPANPFADYSVVFVPYCTGDVHIGNATTDYGDGIVVHHNGYTNGTTALNVMVGNCSPTPPRWWLPVRAAARSPARSTPDWPATCCRTRRSPSSPTAQVPTPTWRR